MAAQNSNNVPQNNTGDAVSKGKQVIISDENNDSFTVLDDDDQIPACNNRSSDHDLLTYDFITEFLEAGHGCSTQFPAGTCSTLQENAGNNGNSNNDFPGICFQQESTVNGISNSNDFPAGNNIVGFENENIINGNSKSNDQFPGICFQQENVCSNGNSNATDFNTQNWAAFGNPIEIPSLPIASSLESCSFCQTLREYFHVNDSHTMKLEIHGKLGIISHAVQHIDNSQFYLFDFSQESISSVKQFLYDYCDARKREGYSILQDPLSEFYKAMCIGLDTVDNSLTNKASTSKQTEEERNIVGAKQTKRDFKEQRRRMKNMRLQDLVGLFHLPIQEAADQMALSLSSIKKLCRDEDVKKWPYKKIKGIKGKMAKNQKRLEKLEDPNVRESVSKEIEDLQQTLDYLYQTHFKSPQTDSAGRARKKQLGRKRGYTRRENQSTADGSEMTARVKRRGKRPGGQVSIEDSINQTIAETPNVVDALTQTRQSNRNKKNIGK